MVKSGLVERISVSASRLTAHLGLALGILAVSVWTYSELRARTAVERSEPVATPRRWQRALLSAAVLLGITVLSGGFVAGLRGGRIFNEFPLMGGRWCHPGTARSRRGGATPSRTRRWRSFTTCCWRSRSRRLS
jgi:cytochrome c oxidase assembly protein subunit 15